MAGSDAGPGGAAAAGTARCAAAVLRSWDEAEARLFPLVMAQPELYQQALGAIQQLLGRLRETCQDLPALLAAHERGGDLVDGAECRASGPAGLIAAAACAMRYRELVARARRRGRLAALARARDQGLSWTVAEENGQPERAPYVPYQRVEAEPGTGRAVIVSIGPDETLSRAVYRLDAGQIDLASGALRIGDPLGSYLDPDECSRRPPPNPGPPRLARPPHRPRKPATIPPGLRAAPAPTSAAWPNPVAARALELLPCLLLRRCICEVALT